MGMLADFHVLFYICLEKRACICEPDTYSLLMLWIWPSSLNLLFTWSLVIKYDCHILISSLSVLEGALALNAQINVHAYAQMVILIA